MKLVAATTCEDFACSDRCLLRAVNGCYYLFSCIEFNWIDWVKCFGFIAPVKTLTVHSCIFTFRNASLMMTLITQTGPLCFLEFCPERLEPPAVCQQWPHLQSTSKLWRTKWNGCVLWSCGALLKHFSSPLEPGVSHYVQQYLSLCQDNVVEVVGHGLYFI